MKERQNTAIRQEAERAGVYLWQVADALGISDATLSRWLRHELAPEVQTQILDIIEQLKGGGGE